MGNRYFSEAKLPYAQLAAFFGSVCVEVQAGVTGDVRFFDRAQQWREVDAHQGVLAELLGVSRRTIARWVNDGVSLGAADRAAVTLGAHPSEIWVEWFDLEVAS